MHFQIPFFSPIKHTAILNVFIGDKQFDWLQEAGGAIVIMVQVIWLALGTQQLTEQAQFKISLIHFIITLYTI